MPELLHLGPFTVQTAVAAVLLAAIVGMLFIKLRLKLTDAPPYSGKLFDIVLNGLFILLLVWKFGTVLTVPSLIWKNPLTILYAYGGVFELAIGIAAALIYAAYRMWKLRISPLFAADILAYGIAPAVAAYQLLVPKYGARTDMPWGVSVMDPAISYHPLHLYVLLVAVAASIWIWIRPRRIGQGEASRDLLLSLGAGLMLVSFFDPAQHFGSFLSSSQLLYLGMILLGMMHNNARKENATMISSSQNKDGDSLAQKRQERENRKRTGGRDAQVVEDKKLDGPNRPST